jgi:hypothetical protein
VEALRAIRAVLADRTMTAAQRVAVAAVIVQADSTTGCAWASYRQLGADYGVTVRVVAHVLATPGGIAIGRHLAVAGRGQHGATRYRVLGSDCVGHAQDTGSDCVGHAQDTGSACVGQAQDAGSACVGQAQDAGSACVGRSILAPVREEILRPPTPPGGPGGACVPAASPSGEGIETEADAERHVDAAFRAAGEPGLGWLQKRKVRREFTHGGGAELIASIDAAVVTAARAAMPANRSFGWGWVVQKAQAVLARKLVAEKAEFERHAAAASRELSVEEVRRDIERVQAEESRRQAAWANLDAAERDRFIAQARREPMGDTKKPGLLERLAEVAWARANGGGTGDGQTQGESA